MCVFSFIPVACILMHDLSTSYTYFHFVQQVARYEGMDPPHVRVFIYPCSVHLDARPIPLMRIFSFRATSCTLRGDGFPSCACFIYPVTCILMHDLSTSYAYFHFVQQVARYEATYPSHERIAISCNKLHATRGRIPLMSVLPFRATRYMKYGEWCFNVVYFR